MPCAKPCLANSVKTRVVEPELKFQAPVPEQFVQMKPKTIVICA